MNMRKYGVLLGVLIALNNVKAMFPVPYSGIPDVVFYDTQEAFTGVDMHLDLHYGNNIDRGAITKISEQVKQKAALFFEKCPVTDGVQLSLLQQMCENEIRDYCSKTGHVLDNVITEERASEIFARLYKYLVADDKNIKVPSLSKKNGCRYTDSLKICNTMLQDLQWNFLSSTGETDEAKQAFLTRLSDMRGYLVSAFCYYEDQHYSQGSCDVVSPPSKFSTSNHVPRSYGYTEQAPKQRVHNTQKGQRTRQHVGKKPVAALRSSWRAPHAFTTSRLTDAPAFNPNAQSFMPTQRVEKPTEVSLQRQEDVTPMPAVDSIHTSPWDFSCTSPELQKMRRRSATPFATTPVAGSFDQEGSTEALRAILQECSDPSDRSNENSPDMYETNSVLPAKQKAEDSTSRASTARTNFVDDWFARRFK